MPRWSLVLLLATAVVCAGVGAALLLTPSGAASFGWTAYSPLSPSDNGRYMPLDLTWLEWRPRIGTALLAAGAGTTGAALSALLLQRRPSATN